MFSDKPDDPSTDTGGWQPMSPPGYGNRSIHDPSPANTETLARVTGIIRRISAAHYGQSTPEARCDAEVEIRSELFALGFGAISQSFLFNVHSAVIGLTRYSKGNEVHGTVVWSWPV